MNADLNREEMSLRVMCILLLQWKDVHNDTREVLPIYQSSTEQRMSKFENLLTKEDNLPALNDVHGNPITSIKSLFAHR